MLGNLGVSEVILILVIALLLFGPNKLPELGRALGKTLREFKQASSGLLEEEPKAKAASESDPGAAGAKEQASKADAGESVQEERANPRRLPD